MKERSEQKDKVDDRKGQCVHRMKQDVKEDVKKVGEKTGKS
jgi:hypothetical protein